jgi:glycosyltransferase involved in cell wall biosynthesis
VRSICFVTNEVYPLKPGGIGRLMYNFASHNRARGSPVAMHLLLPPTDDEEVAALRHALAGLAEIHVCKPLSHQSDYFAAAIASVAENELDFTTAYKPSVEYLYGLLDAQNAVGRPFDIIEFPDFGGWGVASVAGKRSGLVLQDSLLTVRLHSTFGLITRYEKYHHSPSFYAGALCDLERYQLKYADLVVGHLAAIAERNAEHYRFGKDWLDRVEIEFPPILLDDVRETPGTDPLPQPRHPDFVFSSRLQPFKRPDIFINGAVAFLEAHPGYEGLFRLAAYGWDRDYIRYLENLIPPAFADQILILEGLPASQRQDILNRSIVVVPSDYESLCLFAYEASVLGRKVILSAACEAFDKSERWVERENCLMFDGSAADLARAMTEAIRWVPQRVVDATADLPYWHTWTRADRARTPGPSKTPEPLRTAIACIGFTSGEEVTKTALMMSLTPLDDVDVHFFLPRAALGPDSAAARMVANNGWTAQFLSGRGLQPRELGARLAKLQAEVIVLWPHGYQLHPQFIARARGALARQPDLAVYSSHVRVLDPDLHTPTGVGIYGGEMPSLALLGNIVTAPAAAIRRGVLNDYPFDDRARGAWYQAWIRQLVLAGKEVLIAPEIQVDQTTAADGNSSQLCASLADDLGLAHALPARLIAMEPVRVWNLASRLREREVTRDELQSAVCVWPQMSGVRDFPLVVYRSDVEGLMVHPLNESAVIARISGPGGAIRKVVAETWNSHGGNDGVEVSIAIAERVSPDLLATLARGGGPLGTSVAQWMPLPPNARRTVTLTSMAPPARSNSILLMSRVKRGGLEQYCHSIFTHVQLVVEGAPS